MSFECLFKREKSQNALFTTSKYRSSRKCLGSYRQLDNWTSKPELMEHGMGVIPKIFFLLVKSNVIQGPIRQYSAVDFTAYADRVGYIIR